MAADANTGTIEKTVLIQATPQLIFKALTEAKDLAQWFCDRVTSDPRIGGELKAYWRMGISGQAQRGRAVFTKLVPDAQVEMRWLDDGGGEAAQDTGHVLSYTIRLKRGTSEVQIRDQGPPFEDEESQQFLSQGWISVLRDLKEHCEAKQRSTRRRTAESERE
jgi:uncharacterized protein YndB with AHSA1/START domain